VYNSVGNELIREKRPEMHTWATSTSWLKMDAAFRKVMRENRFLTFSKMSCYYN